eukprot:TRINITY_DN9778_c0_g2_i2.p1 TRINITY_DN9778_c0_g2~~TRINITY_DN9778_c0_g2_i2.p1  ORF type:complete len:326 (+),score=55.25 TRINITY_DN9778_c0_g2_i2:152-1129(+)
MCIRDRIYACCNLLLAAGVLGFIAEYKCRSAVTAQAGVERLDRRVGRWMVCCWAAEVTLVVIDRLYGPEFNLTLGFLSIDGLNTPCFVDMAVLDAAEPNNEISRCLTQSIQAVETSRSLIVNYATVRWEFSSNCANYTDNNRAMSACAAAVVQNSTFFNPDNLVCVNSNWHMYEVIGHVLWLAGMCLAFFLHKYKEAREREQAREYTETLTDAVTSLSIQGANRAPRVSRPPKLSDPDQAWVDWIRGSELALVALLDALGEQGVELAVQIARTGIYGKAGMINQSRCAEEEEFESIFKSMRSEDFPQDMCDEYGIELAISTFKYE